MKKSKQIQRQLPRGQALLVGMVLSCAALILGCDAVTSAEPKSYALLYGVSLYLGTMEGSSPNLTWPDNDALDMAGALTDQGWQTTVRVNNQATRSQLDTDLAGIQAQIQAGDRVLLYFSGHGFKNTGSKNYLGSWIALRGFILSGSFPSPYTASDSQLQNNFGTEAMLNDQRLAQHIAPIREKGANVIIIIDTCNSGGLVSSGAYASTLPDNYDTTVLFGASNDFLPSAGPNLGDLTTPDSNALLPASTVNGGVWVMSAAGQDEFSYESGAFQNGIFTYCLINTIATADLNRDGYTTLQEWYRTARNSLDELWNSEVAGIDAEDYEYLPHLSGTYTDIVVFTR